MKQAAGFDAKRLLPIFRANDIRGVYNKDFDLSFCKILARLLAGLFQQLLSPAADPPRILVGRDARLSSPEIAAALCLRLREEGMDAADIGLAPSPLCYFLAHHESLSAAIVITASHNPPEYNGFKIMLNRRLKAPRPVQRLRERLQRLGAAAAGPLPPPPRAGSGRARPGDSAPAPDLAGQPAPSGMRLYKGAGRPQASPAARGASPAPLRLSGPESGFSGRAASGPAAAGAGPEWLPKDPFAAYIASLKSEFSHIEPVPFVIDAGSGALGPLAKRALAELGLSPALLFCEPDGRFPGHHPDPTIEENLKDLKNKVRKTGALFGAGFDGDGDRLAVVTKSGRTVLGDEFGFLFLPSLLSKAAAERAGISWHDSPPPENNPLLSKAAAGRAGCPGGGGGFPSGGAGFSKNKAVKSKPPLIVADVKCSDWFFQSVEGMGGRVFMSKSGHGLIREEMERRKAVFAVEFSGHVFFNDRKNRGFDDGLYALLRLLEILNQNPDLDSLLPNASPHRTGEIRKTLPPAEIKKALRAVRAYLEKRGEAFRALDGIRLSRKTGWALFRSSRTQEALTMRFEAESARALADLKSEFSSVIGMAL